MPSHPAASSPPPTPTTRSVECYHCFVRFDVPPKAISLSCPHCYKRVTLHDVIVKDTCWTGRVETCGRIVIERKGSLVASVIHARLGIEILGHAEGRIVSGGPVLIGPRARVKGSLAAPSMWVEPGAVIEGGPFEIVGPDRLAPGPSRPPVPPIIPEVVIRPDQCAPAIMPAWAPIMRPT